MREADGGARWRRIKKLSLALSEQLSSDARAVWLELEEALHAHWLDVATDQYNRGIDVGRAHMMLKLKTGDRLPLEERLRALVVMLSAIADELRDD